MSSVWQIWLPKSSTAENDPMGQAGALTAALAANTTPGISFRIPKPHHAIGASAITFSRALTVRALLSHN
jgi:hypothetical protein